MLQKLRGNNKGFTLIELMIVIAIIGILAAIAVPQFIAYRARANNTSAEAMIGVSSSALGALNYDIKCYGVSAQGTLNAAPGGSGAGAALLGTTNPISSAGPTSIGAMVTGTVPVVGTISSVPFAVPSGVDCRIDTEALANASYMIISESSSGSRAFGAEAEVTGTIYFVQNESWNNSLAALDSTAPPGITIGPDFDPTGLDVGVPGGGVPTANWHVR